MTRYAVLLRGINLGRSRRIGMADLRALLTEEGYGQVATLLQSGNVVLDSDLAAAPLREALEATLEKRFGMPIEVILRSRDELAAVAKHNPLGDVADDGSRYVVAFLAAPFTGEDPLAGVDAGDERYVISGSEMYLWLPGGQQNSPLMKALGRIRSGRSATVRNWNTVEKLLALLDRPRA